MRTFWISKDAKLLKDAKFWISKDAKLLKDAKFLHADNEDPNQIAQIHRLICVFIGQTWQGTFSQVAAQMQYYSSESISTGIHSECISTGMHSEFISTAIHSESISTVIHSESISTAIH